MKIKINWGWAMVIVMAIFMVFILQYVYKTLTDDRYEHQLVSEDYYKDELYYQQEIDKLNNASKLSENVSVKRENGGLQVTFPTNINLNKVTGEVRLLRNSDKALDFKRKIDLQGNTMLIKDDRLINGRWNIKVDWKIDSTQYMFKEAFFY